MSKCSNDPEQTVWLRVTKNGDKLAFNHIIEKYQQAIYNICYRMLKNRDEAEDAAQEVFMRAYFKRDSYNEARHFSNWLFSIASHYCIDRLRTRQIPLVSWDSLDPWYSCPDQNIPQPEIRLLKVEAAQEVRLLLDKLPSDYRIVIVLKYWYAMSCEEIAQMLDTTAAAIKSRLFRARKLMATRITTAQATALQSDVALASGHVVLSTPPALIQPEVMQ